MTEFKKWSKEVNWKDYVNSIEDDDFLNEIQEDAAKAGWKAALEWAKGRIDYGNAGNDMIDWIFEEELNAKTKA